MTNASARFGHWAAKYSEAKKWKKAVFAEINFYRIHLEHLPWQKVKLICVRHSSNEPDYDGLVSSFKHVIDGLVQGGIIQNDRPSNFASVQYLWQKAKPREGKITIQVERFDEET